VVQLLLAREGVDVNKTAHNGFTALYMASQKGHVEVVGLLLARQGVEVNKTTDPN
jgi:ankyrin repeat protein